jgi:hypothetical protein
MVWLTAARTLEETKVAFGGGLESGESGGVHGGYVRGASRGGERGPVDERTGVLVWFGLADETALTKDLGLFG